MISMFCNASRRGTFREDCETAFCTIKMVLHVLFFNFSRSGLSVYSSFFVSTFSIWQKQFRRESVEDSNGNDNENSEDISPVMYVFFSVFCTYFSFFFFLCWSVLLHGCLERPNLLQGSSLSELGLRAFRDSDICSSFPHLPVLSFNLL